MAVETEGWHGSYDAWTTMINQQLQQHSHRHHHHQQQKHVIFGVRGSLVATLADTCSKPTTREPQTEVTHVEKTGKVPPSQSLLQRALARTGLS